MSKPLEKLYCYLRVSSERQQKDGGSLEVQRSFGKKVSKKLGMEYVELFEGSSSTMVRSEEEVMNSTRVVYEQLKESIQNGEIKNLWIFSMSRLHRDTIQEQIFMRFFMEPNKVKLFVGERGKQEIVETPDDYLQYDIKSLFSRYQKELTSYVSRKGKMRLSKEESKKGRFMGGTVNFGYKVENKYYKKHPQESKLVKKIFEMYSKGESLKEIKIFFDSNNVKPRRSKTWSLGSLHRILMNRIYIGEYRWIDKKTEEEFFITTPRIVSYSLFSKVQKKLTMNQKNKGSNLRKFDSLLDNSLECYCGETITSQIKTLHGKVVKKYYYCHSKNNNWKGINVKECMNRRTLGLDRTDELVSDTVREIVGNSSLLKEKFKVDVLDKKSLGETEIENEKKKKQNYIDNLNETLETLVQSMSTNEVNHLTKKTETKVYKQVKDTLEKERIEIEEKKEITFKQIDDLDNQKDWVDWISKYSDDINTSFSNITSDYLEGVVDKIIVSPKMGKNRDNKTKPIGHSLKINFKLPIVNDSIEYNNVKKKSEGYKLKNGTKSCTKELETNLGGRKKKEMKNG